jgi:hypothetical protein
MYPADAERYDLYKDPVIRKLKESSLGGLLPVASEQAQELLKICNESHLNIDIIPLHESNIFSDVVVFSKEENTTKAMVRIFRGVRQIDESIFSQIPYAMRSESGDISINPITLHEIREDVEVLAHYPTYDNFSKYAEKVRPYLSKSEIASLDRDVMDIEDGIMDGRTIREELLFKQGTYNGQYANSGTSPYISATLNGRQRVRFAAAAALAVPCGGVIDF